MTPASVTSERLPSRLVGSVVPLSPTTVWRWSRCRRLYLLRNLVQLPGVDAGSWTQEGLKVHAVLRQLHELGSCADHSNVDAMVESYGAAEHERLRGFLDRHVQRCPQGANYLGGEVPLARLHREPAPVFTTSGAIDALWVHDGFLDARDYKTGAGATGGLADDVRARVQAWMLAPLAVGRGLRLRLRYEFLAPEVVEDPPAWDPEPETLDAVEEELRAVAEAMRAERDFRGVGDAVVCRTCEYRSVCADAAVEAEEPR